MCGMLTSLLLAFSTGGDAPAILGCVALAASVFVFVFGTRPSPGDSAPHRSRLDQLLERRDTIYDNLRDLRFEYRAGKFSERDYEESRLALETEAAVVLTEIEQVTGSPSLVGRKATGHS